MRAGEASPVCDFAEILVHVTIDIVEGAYVQSEYIGGESSFIHTLSAIHCLFSFLPPATICADTSVCGNAMTAKANIASCTYGTAARRLCPRPESVPSARRPVRRSGAPIAKFPCAPSHKVWVRTVSRPHGVRRSDWSNGPHAHCCGTGRVAAALDSN